MSDKRQKRGSLELQQDLRHFLKVARPEWSCRKRHGQCKIARILEKLEAVGVYDTETLVEMVENNTINERLSKAGHVPFGKEALDGMRKQTPFIRALDSISPQVRQVGNFASVPQLLSKKKIIRPDNAAKRMNSSPALGSRPVSGTSAGDRPESGSRLYTESDMSFDSGGDLKLRHAKSTRRRRPVHWQGDNAVWSEEEDGGGSLASTSPMMLLSPSASGGYLDLSHSGGFHSVDDHLTLPVTGSRNASQAGSPRPGALRPNSRGGNGVRTAVSFDAEEDPSPRRGANIGDKTPEATRSPHRPMLSRSNTATSLLEGPMSPTDFRPFPNRELPTPEEMQRMWKIGSNMRIEKLDARWAPSYSKTLVEQGEEILNEQDVIDHRCKFMRSCRSRDMRAFVADNIRTRMLGESGSDTTMGLSMQQHVMNIRKHLLCMTNARRELAGLKSRMNSIQDDDDTRSAKYSEMNS
eukprot:TRINITY_DN21798_c0_g1_i1.p1 TRINITY_DN21798_c0_g1~~TRINITY_DN21798_c0_g1_i1.p1  ORF type:complete len:467 (-),score=101.70 TRINITY_DN21798_c0_g1_i1:121-1521(-)